MKIFPLSKRGRCEGEVLRRLHAVAQRQGVVRSASSRQRPEASRPLSFRFHSSFIKGDFHRRVFVPKLKTHKGAKKRFHVTASGKVKRGHSHARHILTKKTAKRKRKLDQNIMVSAADAPKVKAMLPYA